MFDAEHTCLFEWNIPYGCIPITFSQIVASIYCGPPFPKMIDAIGLEVCVTPVAKAFLDKVLSDSNLPLPGIILYRSGSKALVASEWENPFAPEFAHLWTVCSFESYSNDEFFVVDGIRFHLAIKPRYDETVIAFDFRHGKPFVRSLTA